jgi:hypothetical protein
MIQKTLCPTHHLFYTAVECPLCRQERLEHYSQKYVGNTSEVKPKVEKNREITADDLSKLKNKFNKKL